jgi:indole-3-glycerol phosphate synthase
LTETRQALEKRKQEIPLSGIRALAAMQRRTFDLSSLLKGLPSPGMIAKLKRTDESSEAYKPAFFARQFEAAKVAAIMVQTVAKYYHHSLADLTHIALPAQVPIIRQDYIYDEYQVVEARAAGADAVLLIAALLDPKLLSNLISITQRNRMTAVVQVQNEEELLTAVEFEPRVIAISNRDMHTFQVDLDTTGRLCQQVPNHMAIVSLGGMNTVQEVAYVTRFPIHGVIVRQDLLGTAENRHAIADLFALNPLSIL